MATYNPRARILPSLPNAPSLVGALLVAFCAVILIARSVAAEDGRPTRGGTLRLVFEQEFSTLDPAICLTSDYSAVDRLLFRGLFDYDDQNRLVPEHAEDWSVSDDGKTYTFRLRAGHRFPNGREVEAEDYIFALERVLSPATASSGQPYFTGIRGADEFVRGKVPHVAGLRAPDPRTLVIELVEPSFVFRFKLALPYAFPVPRETVGASQRDFREHLVGSGPYKVAEHKPGLRWKLARNPYYTGSNGFPDTVDITISKDRYLNTMMVERGDVDFSRLTPQDLIRLRHDGAKRGWLRTPSYANVDFVSMNTGLKPFDNVLVRRAVNHAIDRDRLAKLQPPSVAAHGIVPVSMPWENPGLRVYEHDPAKARALLREAGYPDGFDSVLWYVQGFVGRIPEAIEADLRAVGIRIKLNPVSAPALEGKVGTKPGVPMCLWGWAVDYPDATSFFDPCLYGAKITDQSCLNYSFYNQPELDRLMVEADRCRDPSERIRLLQRVESIAMDDAPWVPIVHDAFPCVCNPRLHGFQSHPVWLYRLERLWVDR